MTTEERFFTKVIIVIILAAIAVMIAESMGATVPPAKPWAAGADLVTPTTVRTIPRCTHKSSSCALRGRRPNPAPDPAAVEKARERRRQWKIERSVVSQ